MTEDLDAMDAEFDTVAAWTAEVAAGLDPAHRIPAACRGSGSPGTLHWLLDRVDAHPGQVFLDCGAGVGGPAAFAARETGVRPVLTDPEAGACRAARDLFGLPCVRAATELPVADHALGAGWSLGVLCTVDDQPAYLDELRRVLAPGGLFGLVVYCAAHPGALRAPAPEGNEFPTLDRLQALLRQAALTTVASGRTDDFPELPSDWTDGTAALETELRRRHGDDPRWRAAEEQSRRMGGLLSSGEVVGRMLVVSPR